VTIACHIGTQTVRPRKTFTPVFSRCEDFIFSGADVLCGRGKKHNRTETYRQMCYFTCHVALCDSKKIYFGRLRCFGRMRVYNCYFLILRAIDNLPHTMFQIYVDGRTVLRP